MPKPILTTILRHPKERLSKCSLQPLVGRDAITFIKAKKGLKFDSTNFILLTLDAPILSESDAEHPLLLLDSTWRLLPDLEDCLTGTPIPRTLPHGIKTAYPRISKIAKDPFGGLASVEALYLAKRLLGEDDPSLLDDYHWKAEFLAEVDRHFGT